MEEKKQQSVKLTKKQNIIQVVKFAVFSCMAGVIELVSFSLLKELLEFHYWTAYSIALVLSVLYNFTVNRRFTFKSASDVPIAMIKVFGFYCVFAPLSILGGHWLESIKVNEYIVLAGTMILNLLLEYLFCRFFVYKNSINTNELGIKEQQLLDKEKAFKESSGIRD